MRTMLLVDDDPAGVIAAHAEQGDSGTELVVRSEVDAALDYLLRADVALPVAVVLEPEIASGGGIDLIARVKTHPDLSMIPMIVLTRGGSEALVHESYAARANAVVHKPPGADALARCVARIINFWGRVNHPAPRPRP